MASMDLGQNKGNHRDLNAEVNLVPFIDLLSMCICFLLMTAVWIQIGSVQIKQSHGTEGALTQKNQYELDLKFTGPQALDLNLKQNGKIVKKMHYQGANPEAFLSSLDIGIKGVLGSVMTKGVDASRASEFIANAMVTPLRGVSYGDLVSVMDILRKNKIVNLGVVPVKGT
jgi:biopolymer transport protein ExbD